MAKYSTQADVTDELIKGLSKESDHEEAADYVDKILAKCHYVPTGDAMPTLVQDIAVVYATYKRSFYESTTKQDVFYQKYLSYEKELRELTAQLIKALTVKEIISISDSPLVCELRHAAEALLDVLAGVKDVATRETLTIHALNALITPFIVKVGALQDAIIEMSGFVAEEQIEAARKILDKLK